MKIILILIIGLGLFSSCQKPVEGCTHPRASNFNPEADENKGCTYYQLILDLKHTTHTNNTTFTYGYWLNDVDGTPFYINRLPIMVSQMHLVRASTNQVVKSQKRIGIFDSNGNRSYAEDNFAILAPDQDNIKMAAWVALGSFDKIRFQIGLPSNVRTSNPNRINESDHPLSTSASYYMYDSLTASYATSFFSIILPNTNDTLVFNFHDNWAIELPWNKTIIDGEDITIPLQINYEALFDGVSFLNDNATTIATKIKQNIPAAFSVY